MTAIWYVGELSNKHADYSTTVVTGTYFPSLLTPSLYRSVRMPRMDGQWTGRHSVAGYLNENGQSIKQSKVRLQKDGKGLGLCRLFAALF